MWQVIYIASSKRQAEQLRDRLMNEGFLVKIQPMGSEESDSYQVLVPEGEAAEVVEYIAQAY